MEMEPEPSWSKILKAFCASSSYFLVRYFRIGSLMLNILLNIINMLYTYQFDVGIKKSKKIHA